jgi:hypothetical protein
VNFLGFYLFNGNFSPLTKFESHKTNLVNKTTRKFRVRYRLGWFSIINNLIKTIRGINELIHPYFRSLSASATSCGSSFPASWINSVKKIASNVVPSKSSSSNAKMSVEDIEGDETLAEETSSASNTISSNPSTSSTSSLQRKSKVDQNLPTRCQCYKTFFFCRS